MYFLALKSLLRTSGAASSIVAIALLVAVISSAQSITNYINLQTGILGRLVYAGGPYLIISEDSAIYFALKGAREVIAIEPHPEAYKEMLDNIRLNDLENIIVPINAYLVSERGRARLGDYEIKGSVGKHQNYDGEALVVTLNDVIDRYGIGSDAVLKMDCEGCEYDVVLNDYAHIKTVR
jgi:FkbM family methyltransferase